MVDIGVVENHKENIIPHPNGYRLRVLDEALLPSTRSSMANVAYVAPYSEQADDCDPLSVHLASLEHNKMMSPALGLCSEQLVEIEDCLRQFVTWDLYKNDLRYVSLWLDYSLFSQAPQRIFEYMESERIGWFSALFYERWANFCETVGANTTVVEVLERGIQRQAQPLSRLRFALSSFIARTPTYQREVPGTNVARKRVASPATSRAKKIHVFIDEDKSSDDENDPSNVGIRKFPCVSLENRENKAPVGALNGYVLPQSAAANAADTSIGIRAELGEAFLIFKDTENEEGEQALGFNAQARRDPTWQESASPTLTMLRERRMSPPMRIFDPVPRTLQVESLLSCDNGTGVIENLSPALANIIYAQHAGITEQVPDLFATGPPTENLDRG